VVRFLLTHMERSFDAARHLVADLDAAALAARRRITVPLVRRVLARE
jgi:chromosomal replication initiation ATPase DnaA